MSFIFAFLKRILQSMIQLLTFGKRAVTNTLNIYIKTNTGNTLSIDLDPKWEIKNVKEIVATELGLTPEEVKIIFAGKELDDSIVIEECDLGEQSILHAVKVQPSPRADGSKGRSHSLAAKPLNETLVDLQLSGKDRQEMVSEEDHEKRRAHFYVYCSSPCKMMKPGKLRVRCASCKGGAFTVDRDPQCWQDVLDKNRITGICETDGCTGGDEGLTFAQFYFKCAEHPSQGEDDEAVPLYLIKSNIHDVPCLACTDVKDPVLVFPCDASHVTCLECFQTYCASRLRDRQFWSHPEYGYTLPCPAGCPNSLITEVHHFHLLTTQQYAQYQRFAAEEYVLQAGGILCPQPGCGMGILADPDCRRITCTGGCGFVFCRQCLQGYHIGDCVIDGESGNAGNSGDCQYNVDPNRAAQARWDEASKVVIKVSTKPCPKCRTPTERDGGCMHMVCTRPNCGFHWCWICQTPWSRECMGNHWFG
ncbi:E3 ubiquitin-protein ligase parkin [Schistocerca piceifrons]|uniref:E3 ubiquitin-protein ligase parkin n=1 Tax=Schistocerca piceifrons TaxID=274613 RepID=UPI001F5F72B6|nr:E3 ubiquitin-protein ligase parkin [Schistocerca piceifrons]